MMLAAVFLVILIALRERRDVIVRDVGLATVGRVIGTLPAAYALTILPAKTYEIVFAGLILLAVGLSVLGWHARRTPLNVVIAAMLSGFIGTISSVGGPALAMMYQHESGPKVRGTISAIFTIGTTISLFALWWVGRFGAVELKLGFAFATGRAVGFPAFAIHGAPIGQGARSARGTGDFSPFGNGNCGASDLVRAPVGYGWHAFAAKSRKHVKTVVHAHPLPRESMPPSFAHSKFAAANPLWRSPPLIGDGCSGDVFASCLACFAIVRRSTLLTFFSSRPSGTAPLPSTTSWNARTSNWSPSRASASSRSSRIFSSPILYASAWPGQPM